MISPITETFRGVLLLWALPLHPSGGPICTVLYQLCPWGGASSTVSPATVPLRGVLHLNWFCKTINRIINRINYKNLNYKLCEPLCINSRMVAESYLHEVRVHLA